MPKRSALRNIGVILEITSHVTKYETTDIIIDTPIGNNESESMFELDKLYSSAYFF